MLRLNNLRGFGRAVRDGGSIALFASTSISSTAISLPASIAAGDLIVILNHARDSVGTPNLVTPSGFTNQVNFTGGQTGNNGRFAVHTKLAVGTEGGTSATGMSGDTLTDLVVAVFRRTPAAAGLTISTPNTQATTADPSAQNVAASGGEAPSVTLGCYGATGAISPRTMSPAKTAEANASTGTYLAWLIQNSAPSDVSVDMEDEGANLLASFYISMTG